MIPIESIRLDRQTPNAHPDSNLSEIDVLRQFDNDSASQSTQEKIEKVKTYLAAGDLEELKAFLMAEAMYDQ